MSEFPQIPVRYAEAPVHNFEGGWSITPPQIFYCGLSAGAERTLIGLIRHSTFKKKLGQSNEFMSCYASVATIAAWTNQDDRTVQRGLKELKAKGLIVIERRGHKHMTNKYHLKDLQKRLNELAPRCVEHLLVASTCPYCRGLEESDAHSD